MAGHRISGIAKATERSCSSSSNSTAKSPLSEAQAAPTSTTSRRTRSSLLAPSVQLDDDKVASPLSKLIASDSKIFDVHRRQRKSMGSTTSTAIDDVMDTDDYSTPGTSAVPTPKLVTMEDAGLSSARRACWSARGMQTSTDARAKAFERMTQMRESQFALVPVSKRKRAFSLDDEYDIDDHSTDAQLARALQESEDGEAAHFRDATGTSQARPDDRHQTKKAKIEDTDEESSLLEYEEDWSSESEYFEENSKLKASVIHSKSPAKFIKAVKKKEIAHHKTGPGSLLAQRQSTGSLKEAKVPSKNEAGAGSSESESEAIPSDIFPDVSDEEVDSGAARVKSSANRDRKSFSQLSNTERRAVIAREALEAQHPVLLTMWEDLKNQPIIKTHKAPQPTKINRELKPFQLEGLNWMQEMEKTAWGGGLLADEMGMGKTIQAVSLIMSDYPAKQPSLVLIPPVALMQWQQEIGDYTDGTLKTFVFHATNAKTKGISVAALKKYDVILMSYNSLESMYRFQEKGRTRRDDGVSKQVFQKSVIHEIRFHRVILDEAHNIKSRTTGVAKACFALKADHKWCLSGTPLQNRVGELFSLMKFLKIRPFSDYFCKSCPCTSLHWSMNADNHCTQCGHGGMQHLSVFNQELLNPITKYGNTGAGKTAFEHLRLLTDRFMLRRVKKNHSLAMELPAKEIHVDRHFFGEIENDFANSIMNRTTRQFETYVSQGIMLNNYANIFHLILQMRQVADHPDLILKRNSEDGANNLNCCICDENAEDAIRSNCKHDFCRQCVKSYIQSAESTEVIVDCPRCHIPLAIDLDQPEREQDGQAVKKTSIVNRIKMEEWTSSTKIETLVYDLHQLRSRKSSTKSIIFSQFTTMLQLVEWRLRRAGISTVMLDGSMTPAQRQASINSFMTDPTIECFLVSLKAGGVALNLVEASHVFLVDLWWNPSAEYQAADRCHRIGQARPCTITRLCIEDSVESRIVLLQEKKMKMFNSTINSDDSAMESLSHEDMEFLFRGN